MVLLQVELLQDIKWLFLAAGILLVLAAVFGSGEEPLKIGGITIPRLPSLWAQIISGGVGVVFIGLGMALYIWPEVRLEPRPVDVPQIQITVTRPGAGDEVRFSGITLEGTVNPPLPQGYVVGIVANDGEDCYFLGNKPMTTSNTGRWELVLNPRGHVDLGPSWQGKRAFVYIVDKEHYLNEDAGMEVRCPSNSPPAASFVILGES